MLETIHEYALEPLVEGRAQLGKSTFQAAWSEGQVLTLEQAVTYARSDEPFPPLQHAKSKG